LQPGEKTGTLRRNNMGKILVGAAIGVFVGAFAVELLDRKRPGALTALWGGVLKFPASLADAFKAGYAGNAEAEELPPEAASQS
jgi:hypothetical protein